jgi:hypothetical protein
MDDYKANSLIPKRIDCEYQELRPSLSRPIIDEIDCTLAKHYGFPDEGSTSSSTTTSSTAWGRTQASTR